jgi:4-hydroxy-tetrahydrodipicolinate synthase
MTAMVTPFLDGPDGGAGELDVDGAVRLARWLQEQGNDALVVAGTTGESPVLTDDERLTLFEAVCAAVTIPVIGGTSTNDTPHSVGLTRESVKRGLAGALVVTPYYNRPPQAGIVAHVAACAEAAAGLPVVIYDIPVRTGRKMSHDAILSMARDIPNVVALKDAAGNPGETARVVAEAPAGFEVYSGDDVLTLALMAVGAVGTIGVATHWCTPETVEMFALWAKGDVVGARTMNARMLDSYAFETGDASPNPIPSKAMLRTLGLPAGQCRLPMGPAPDWVEPRAREVYAALVAERGA